MVLSLGSDRHFRFNFNTVHASCIDHGHIGEVIHKQVREKGMRRGFHESMAQALKEMLRSSEPNEKPVASLSYFLAYLKKTEAVDFELLKPLHSVC